MTHGRPLMTEPTASLSSNGKVSSPYHTVEQVAEHLAVCTKTVRRWIQSGDMQAYRFGNQIRISDDNLTEYINQSRYPA